MSFKPLSSFPALRSTEAHIFCATPYHVSSQISERECVYENNNDGRRKHETLKARFLPAYRAFPLPSGVRAFLSRKASLLSFSLSLSLDLKLSRLLYWKMCRYGTFCIQNVRLGHILPLNFLLRGILSPNVPVPSKLEICPEIVLCLRMCPYRIFYPRMCIYGAFCPQLCP